MGPKKSSAGHRNISESLGLRQAITLMVNSILTTWQIVSIVHSKQNSYIKSIVKTTLARFLEH